MASNKFLQRRMRLEFVDELIEIVGQSPYNMADHLAKLLSCWNNTIMVRLKEFGYKNMCFTVIFLYYGMRKLQQRWKGISEPTCLSSDNYSCPMFTKVVFLYG